MKQGVAVRTRTVKEINAQYYRPFPSFAELHLNVTRTGEIVETRIRYVQGDHGRIRRVVRQRIIGRTITASEWRAFERYIDRQIMGAGDGPDCR